MVVVLKRGNLGPQAEIQCFSNTSLRMWDGYWAQALVGLSDSLARVGRRWEAGCLATNNSFDGNSLPQVRNPGTWKPKFRDLQTVSW